MFEARGTSYSLSRRSFFFFFFLIKWSYRSPPKLRCVLSLNWLASMWANLFQPLQFWTQLQFWNKKWQLLWLQLWTGWNNAWYGQTTKIRNAREVGSAQNRPHTSTCRVDKCAGWVDVYQSTRFTIASTTSECTTKHNRRLIHHSHKGLLAQNGDQEVIHVHLSLFLADGEHIKLATIK